MKKSPLAAALILALLALLAACADLPTPQPLPPTQWLRVQVSPSLALSDDLLSACTPAGAGLALQGVTGAAFAADQVDLTLRWGAPPDSSGYSAQIGEDELVPVVHPSNSVQALTFSALQTTFAGGLPGWDWDFLGQTAQPLSVYAYPASSDIQAILASQLLPSGQPLPREVVVAPGPAQVREAVAADPGALGFLPRRWVDASVKAITVTGLPAGAWTKPILALSAVEPQGIARAWLLCVQQGIK